MTRGYDAQKKEAMLVMKINDKNVRIKFDTGAEVSVMPTRVFSQIENTEDVEQSNVKFKGHGVQFQSLGKASSDDHTTYKVVNFYIVESSSKTALGLGSCQDFR